MPCSFPVRYGPVLAAFSLLFAALIGAAGEGEGEEPVFVVHTTAGKDVRGPLHSLAGDWALQVGKGVRRKLAGDEWISLRRAGGRRPDLPWEEQLIFSTGERVPARDVRLEGEKLVFQHPDLNGGKDVSVPLEVVSVFWRTAPEKGAELKKDRLRRALATGSRSRDTVLLRNGDTLEGTLNALDGKNVEVEGADKKVRSVRTSQVAAVALSTELASKARPRGVYSRLVAAPSEDSPGGRFLLAGATCDGGTLRGKTTFGALIRLPLERVAALDLCGGKVEYLSDVAPARYEEVPYLDLRHGWTADAAVTGRDMRLGGNPFDRGIGMHGGSRLTWKLDGAYRRFEAVVGLDDRGGRQGRVEVRVLVDGEPAKLPFTGELTHADGPRAVSVKLDGARELTLEVREGAVQGVVDWGDARLIR